MTRYPDWEQRLGAYLQPLRARAYALGQHDCATFAAGAVMAMTGVDLMPEFRGRYSTKRGAATALRRGGARTLLATMDGKLDRVVPALARRGDLAMVDGGLGIVFGAEIVMVGVEGEREGLIRRARVDATAAWTVPA